MVVENNLNKNMEQGQPAIINSASVPEPVSSSVPLLVEKKKSSILKIVIGGFVLIMILAIAFAYGKVYLKNKELTRYDNLKKANDLVLQENSVAMDQFYQNSSTEEQSKFAQGVDATLSRGDLFEPTRDLLLLRKAIVVSTVRGSDTSASNRNEATDIFKKFIISTSTSPANLYLKDSSIAGFVRLHFQCCATRPFSQELPDLFDTYKRQGYDDKISRLLTLNALTNQVSLERKDDATIVSQSMLIKAQLLDIYRDKLSPATYSNIINELKENLNSYSGSEFKIFTDKASIELENTLYYAYAYDMYYSLTQSGAENNKKIDDAYELAFQKLNTVTKESDKISTNMLKLFNAARYLKSLDRRYAGNVDKNKKESLINLVLGTINSSPEVKKVADSYFKAGLMGNSANMGYLVKLSTTNKALATYMASIGITQEDVSKMP
ncbi:MAG: hypothetical protein JWQ09_3904 [Segetibacter sp.]|nr:hypothetical protein [Segetibacter sp.]